MYIRPGSGGDHGRERAAHRPMKGVTIRAALADTCREHKVGHKGALPMSLRTLIMILAATALLAGAGVAGAFASSPGHAQSGGTTATTTCTGGDDQGENEQGDEESDAATEVEQAATKVDQEAGRQQADDQSGDDQQGEQGDEQGENDDCGD